jgi:aspartyl-tRNA synthetase
MGFADEHSVMRFVESLIASLWNTMLNVPLSVPFPRVSYQDAMARYGSDKPDVRLGMEVRMTSIT